MDDREQAARGTVTPQALRGTSAPEGARLRPRIDIRGLLRDREFIKVTTFGLRVWQRRRVLDIMEDLRNERRTDANGNPLNDARPILPEMTAMETLREINWRIETLPPRDAGIVAQFLARLVRRETLRRRKHLEGARPRVRPGRGRSRGPR